MRILVCNPPGRFPGNRYVCPFPSRWTSMFKNYPVFIYYPYELAYLSTLLKREFPNDYVKMVDGTYLRFTAEDYIQYLEMEKPDWIIFEVDTVTYQETLRIAKAIKYKLGTRIIITGQYPTAFPQEVLADGMDYALIGEFEEAVCDILNGKDPKTISGVYPNSYRKVLDIDWLPDPEDEDIRRIDYSYCGGHRWTKYREIEVHASRGCPYTCDFCVAGTVYYEKENWRFRKPERIVAEIENLRRKYPEMEGCWFNEETHIIRKKDIMAFCNALIESGNNDLHYEAMANHQRIDEEILEMLKKAGYYKLRLGIETVDEATGQSIGRKTKADRLHELLKAAKKMGIEIYGTFMIGASGSTKEGDRKTIDYGKKLISEELISSWQVSISVPHPGTTFYKKALDHGWIQTNDLEDFNGSFGTTVSYPNYSSDQIMESVKTMAKEFREAAPYETLRPKRSIISEKTAILKKDKPLIDQMLKSLNELYESGEYEKTLEEGQKIVDQFPNVLSSRYVMGKVFMQMGQLKKARELFEYIYQTAMDYDDALQFGHGAHYRLGMINLKEGNSTQALQHFKSCMHLNPDHLEARKQYWELVQNEIQEPKTSSVA